MRDGIASTPPTDAGASRPGPWFRRVTFYSVLAGLCPLIPVPFLDDRALAAVRRRMTGELARRSGVALTPLQVDYLAGTWREPRGCVERAGLLLFALTVRLAAKLVRKLLIVLAAKEAVDEASRAFHEGYLLHLLFDPAGAATRAPAGDHGAWRARWAIERTLAEVDPRPVNQALGRAFRASRRLLRRGSRVLGRAARAGAGAAAAAEAEEERLLGGMLDRLAGELWDQQGYLAGLGARLLYWLGRAEPPAAPEP